MANILWHSTHILQQTRERYKLTDPQAMLDRVVAALQGQAPRTGGSPRARRPGFSS